MDVALALLRTAGVVLVEANLDGIGDINNKISFPIALYEVGPDLTDRLERRPGTKNTKLERAGSKSYRVFSRLRACPGVNWLIALASYGRSDRSSRGFWKARGRSTALLSRGKGMVI